MPEVARADSPAVKVLGKSREDIETTTRNYARHELLDLIYSLATCEPHLKVSDVAARRGMSKQKVLQLVRNGKLRAHKPLENGIRIPLSAVRAWDANTALFSKDELERNGRDG